MQERTIPILPCTSDLDTLVAFYEALGFAVTFRQARPNPYLCVTRGGLDLHFSGIEGFDPAQSTGSAIVLVSDSGALFADFAEGLRGLFGKLPLEGIPRVTRPRRKQGTSGGFTVVDPGGNWLRVTSMSEPEDAPAGALERVLLNAARQGDARGDTGAAILVIEAGLARHPDSSAADLVPVLAYLAELFVRAGEQERAASALDRLESLGLSDAERESLAEELAAAGELRLALRP
jgi:hypothetical protein